MGNVISGLLGRPGQNRQSFWQPSPWGGQPVPWWEQVQQRAQMQNQGPAPYFYQQAPLNYYQPSQSPYSFMPQIQQPSGFTPTPTAEPIMTPEVNNPADPMMPQTQAPAPAGPSQDQIAALTAAREAIAGGDPINRWDYDEMGYLGQRARRQYRQNLNKYNDLLYKTVIGGGS